MHPLFLPHYSFDEHALDDFEEVRHGKSNEERFYDVMDDGDQVKNVKNKLCMGQFDLSIL